MHVLQLASDCKKTVHKIVGCIIHYKEEPGVGRTKNVCSSTQIEAIVSFAEEFVYILSGGPAFHLQWHKPVQSLSLSQTIAVKFLMSRMD